MGIVAPTQDQIYDFGLYLLDGVLRDAGRSLSQFENMPQSRMDWDMRLENRLIAEQLRYDRPEERAHLERRFLQLNTEQLDAYSQIATSVEEEQGRLFFLNGQLGRGRRSSTTQFVIRFAVKVGSFFVLRHPALHPSFFAADEHPILCSKFP